MKKSQLLNFFRVTLLLLIFSVFSSSAWGVTLYLKTGDWQTNNARFSAYFFGSGTTWVSMTKVSDGVYSCEAPSGCPSVIFCRMNGGTTDNNWDNNNRWEQTGDLTVPTDGKNLYDRSNSSWSTYSGEDTGGDTGGSSVVLPTQKGACQKIVIQSKNDYGLYVFKDANSINGLTWNGSVNNKGTKVGNYYQWVIDGNDYVQIIFRNSEGKKSGDSDILYGGYNYIFDKDYTIDDNGTQKPVPTSFSEVDCGSGDDDDTGECKTLYLKPTSNWDKDGARYVAYFFKDGVGHTWMNMEKSSTCSDVYKVAVPDIDLTNVIFVRMNGKKLANTWDSKWNQTSNLTFSGSNNLYTITNIDGDGYWGSSSCTDKAECYTCKLNNFDETNLEAVKCDPNNTKIIFRETFTFTDDQVDNADKSRIEYSVSNEKYSASIPSYFAMTTPCSAIKDGGYYAMVLNPYYAGWGEVGHGDVDSDCNASGHRWFREMEGGHSPVLDSSISASKDGMLLFNCKDGTDKCIPDILYECVVNDICPNTYINFSAYITRANTNASAEKKILAEFRLLNPENNDVLAVKEVKNVELTEEWKEISAMFNSSKATKVKIQLINKAESGTGNDILLDDITFSVCSPQAQLVFSGTNSSTATIIQSQSKTLEASITNGLMTESWYIWQLSTDNVTWTNISTTPIQVVVNQAATLPVSPSKKTYYRAIVASNKSDADAIYGGHDPSACGMYAITNIATLDVTINNLELTSAITDDDICVDGVDATTLTLTVKNPRLVDVTDVEVKLENITDLIITKKSGTGSYSSGKWSVGDDIPAGESVSIELNITSSVSAVTSKVIQSYVSSVDETETYDSYLKAPEESKAPSTLKLNPLPAPPTVTEYKECATTGELYLYDLVDVSDKSGLIFYETETSTTSIDTEISKKNTGINNDYYFTYEEEGKCVSKRGKVHVTILPKPEAKITSGGSQTFCAAENYSFSISAEAKNGTGIWSVTSGEASIANVNSASTTAVVKAGETATLKWTVANEKCDSSATTTLQVDKLPTITIVADKGSQTICSKSEFTVAVEEFTGSGIWKILSETSSKTEAFIGKPNEKETPVTGIESGEKVELQYTANNGECKSIKSEVVTLKNLVCNNFSLTNTFNDDDKEICLNSPTSLTISITNNSQATSTNIKTSIVLPEGLTYVSHSSGANYDNTTGLWTIASLGTEDENKTAELTINVIGSSEGSHTVNAIIKEATETEVEGMEIPSTIKVNALPSAAFDITSSTICIDEQDKESTNIKVNFTGAPNFNLTYKVNNGADSTKTNLSSPYYIEEQLSNDATIMLVSVTDANGCTSAITGKPHQVTTKTHASLGALTAPNGVCNGRELALTAPAVTNNKGAEVTNPKWFLDGKEFDPATTVNNEQHNGKPLYYQITSSCNGKVRDITTTPAVDVTVYATPQLSVTYTDPKGNEVTETQISCAIPSLTATLSGAETYTWTDGSTQNPRVLGQKGQTTKYQVTGVTAQNCTSEPLTITVTEDFDTPDVAIAVSDADKTITCSVTEITLTASSNTAGVTYKWDDANETASATLKVATSNTYKVTATNSTNGCSATATETIGINTTEPVIVITSKDANGKATSTLNCTVEASALTLVPSVTNVNSIGGPVTFVWDGDNTIPTERPVNEAKRYTVAATGANGCSASQFIDIALDDDVPTLNLTASAADITCSVQSSVLTAQATPSAGVTYAWNTNESGSQITVNAGGTYEVVATAVNGCTVTKSVTIDQHTDLPNVTISSIDPKQYCRVNTLTASGADTYVWNTNQTTASIEVSEGGEYWVEGTNAYGCSARAELNLENDKETPVVAISSDIDAITCTNATATLTATITNEDDTRTYSYEWSPKSGTNSTLSVTEGKTYKVVVTDGTNYCKGEKTITVAQHTEKPMVDVKTLPEVCLPATIDLAQAIGPNTLADNVVFYEDEALTQEITNTTIDLSQYKVFYVQGQQVNGNGCMGDAQPVAANVKAVTPAPIVKDYDECTKAGSEKFSSLITSSYYKLNFYASENDETPIADAFDASASNTTTTYYVSNTNQGACESERVEFQVNIYGYIDFSVVASDTRLPAGRDVTITVTPLTDTPVDEYVWYRGEEVIQSTAELELTEQLYLSEKYSVQAIGRCNSPKKEVEVEAVWPTAFTPHNGNGKNDDFAKGMPIIVFNRFYTKIYEGPDGWDGSINGTMNESESIAVPGVYYYSVQLPNGEVKKGTIEIVR